MNNAFAFSRWHFSKFPTFLKWAANQLQWEKIGLPDPFGYGPLSGEARVNCRIIDGRKAGATVRSLLFYRRRYRDYWHQRISDRERFKPRVSNPIFTYFSIILHSRYLI